MAVKAETPMPMRRPTRPKRTAGRLLPYGMTLPTLVVLALVLGYPLFKLISISLRQYGFKQALNPNAPAPFNGVKNYRDVLTDSTFWTVLERTVLLTLVWVGATILIGLALALLMRRCANWMRILLSLTMISVWAMPRVVQTEIFKWLTDYEFGVVNYVLAHLGFSGFRHYNWFVASNTTPGWVVISALIVWGALPFVVITFYAALTQVPKELVEAATVDGAGPLLVFRHVIFPVIKPMLVIVTTLSVIWDFSVFDQIYVMLDNVPDHRFWTMGVYLYEEAFRQGHFGAGAAISIIMILLMFVAGAAYLRQMIRLGEAS